MSVCLHEQRVQVEECVGVAGGEGHTRAGPRIARTRGRRGERRRKIQPFG